MERFSAAGSRHGYDNTQNQDAAVSWHCGRYSAMVLADGVSTCAQAKAGAAIACETAAAYLMQHSARIFDTDPQQTAHRLLARVCARLEETALAQQHQSWEYSSTLALVLHDAQRGQMLYCNVGDGLIAAVRDGLCCVIAAPADSRSGCCVTTTLNAAFMASAGIVETGRLSSVIICSDGAWHLMYRRTRMQPAVCETLVRRDYDQLKTMLLAQERCDDCTFIAMELRAVPERNVYDRT